ncbi:MAG: 1-(5-phosphoribosyl)-5-[Clostridia bacterium]|nr:1-(5-phosphoribosyl)-5-[(5-phosphoribosylamino)methylideneamino]imidazole-4-carboxamide isomerase [Clostridia bacterium]
MIIIPAIDLIDGQVVRLLQGDYSKQKSYALSPLAAAEAFAAQGAEYLHVVDLDGARSGKPENSSVISELCGKTGLRIEVGGGIRSEEQVVRYLEAGVARVILGTVVVKDPGFTENMIRKYGSHIVAGIDARDGWVAVNGWETTSEVSARDLCQRVAELGVSTVIYTDISRDGAMRGVNLPAYVSLRELKGLSIIASGGVTGLDDIRNLKEIGVDGAIIGKALYENRIQLKEAIQAARG